MEQVEGGDLVVNKGHESKPREKAAEKNLNAVEGLETAFRLAEVFPVLLSGNIISFFGYTGKRRRTDQVKPTD